MKTILFDIDGVLADFVEGFTKLAHEMYATDVVRTVDQKTWDILGELDATEKSDIWRRVATDHGFWVRLTPLVGPSVFAEINNLSIHNHVVFATNRFVGTPGPQYQTAAWLQKCGVARPNVVLSRRKDHIASVLDVDFSIEDKLENAEAIAAILPSDARTFIIRRPYNEHGRHYESFEWVNSVSEFLREVDNG